MMNGMTMFLCVFGGVMLWLHYANEAARKGWPSSWTPWIEPTDETADAAPLLLTHQPVEIIPPPPQFRRRIIIGETPQHVVDATYTVLRNSGVADDDIDHDKLNEMRAFCDAPHVAPATAATRPPGDQQAGEATATGGGRGCHAAGGQPEDKRDA